MKIRLLSDLHNEFSIFDVPVMEDDHEQILILAGDIGVAQDGQRQNTIIDFLEAMSVRFKKVLYIMGNHEYYNCDKDKVLDILYTETDHLANVVILQDSLVEIDGVIFVGSTLWTDLKEGDPLILAEAKNNMNDYWLIKKGDERLTPVNTMEEHYISREYLFFIASENRDKKVVMIVHHAPSYKSVAMKYRGGEFDMVMNYNFHSNLDEELEANDNIALLVHGHTHTNFDYMVGKTRVVCNPRGYSKYQDRQENAEFNGRLVLEI